MVQLRYVTVPWSLFYTTLSGRIIDNRQIDNQNLQIDKLQMYNWQIDNWQIDNLQIDNRQIDDMTFSKIDSAIPLCLASWIWKLTTWCWYLKYRGWVGEGLSNFFILASWVRNWQHGIVALKKCIFWYDRRGDRVGVDPSHNKYHRCWGGISHWGLPKLVFSPFFLFRNLMIKQERKKLIIITLV